MNLLHNSFENILIFIDFHSSAYNLYFVGVDRVLMCIFHFSLCIINYFLN